MVVRLVVQPRWLGWSILDDIDPPPKGQRKHAARSPRTRTGEARLLSRSTMKKSDSAGQACAQRATEVQRIKKLPSKLPSAKLSSRRDEKQLTKFLISRDSLVDALGLEPRTR